MSQPKLSVKVLAAYAMPGLAMSLLISPFPALLTTFYARHTAATTAGIATLMLLARILHGGIDPLIGFLSDATVSRIGPRKPWLIGGGLAAMLAFWLAYMPPAGAGNAYFGVAMVSFYVATSLIEIPFRSWSGEISTDYAQRSRIAAWLTLTLLVGGVLFMLLPTLLSEAGLVKTASLDGHMMAIFGWTGVALMPLCVLLAVAWVPVGDFIKGQRYSVREMLATAAGNKPYRLFLAADSLTQVAWGATYAVLFIALDNYFGFGAQVSVILLVATAAQIVALPACTALAARHGKHRVWAWASVLSAVGGPLTLLFPPAGQASLVLMLVFMGAVSAFGTPQMVFPMAMISDIADYDTMRTSQVRTGTYFAFRALISTTTFALGNSIAFYALSAVGYDPARSTNPPGATTGMLLVLTLLPAACNLGAGLLLLRYPITQNRHRAIRRRLDRDPAVALASRVAASRAAV